MFTIKLINNKDMLETKIIVLFGYPTYLKAKEILENSKSLNETELLQKLDNNYIKYYVIEMYDTDYSIEVTK